MENYLIIAILLLPFISFAQNDPMYDRKNAPIISQTVPAEDIQFAGDLFEKASRQYTTSKVLYILSAAVPLALALRNETKQGHLFIGIPIAVVGLGFSFSADSNLRKAGGLLKGVSLK